MPFLKNGFLGNNSSFMLDFVVSALVLIVPLLILSLYLVKIKKNYTGHRNLQILLGIVLLTAVSAFEVDMRMHGGWENIVAKREIPLNETQLAEVRQILYVHLVFAISTPVLWTVTIFLALKRFPSPPVPTGHSKIHKLLGWCATIDLVLTTVTGLFWYYKAFIS